MQIGLRVHAGRFCLERVGQRPTDMSHFDSLPTIDMIRHLMILVTLPIYGVA
jgi:hypothetical protein